jgi:hypothetical protein
MTPEVAHKTIEDALDESGLPYFHHEGAQGGLAGIIVELPGERRLKTNTILTVGEHSVRVEAFVCRKPDENHEGVYRFMLKRNRRLYGVAYTLDNLGDIYLVGRMALASVTTDEIDRILGQVLEAVDEDFNTLLELGFSTSIRREWAWRVSRGESLKNLEAFQHLIDERSREEQHGIDERSREEHDGNDERSREEHQPGPSKNGEGDGQSTS